MQLEVDFVNHTPKLELLTPIFKDAALKSICLRICPVQDPHDKSLIICGQELGCIQLVDFIRGEVVQNNECDGPVEIDIRELLKLEYAKTLDKKRTINREKERIIRHEEVREKKSIAFIKVLNDRLKKTKSKYLLACENLKILDEFLKA